MSKGLGEEGVDEGWGRSRALPGAQPPRGAGGSRRAQGNALSPERLMAHQPGRNGPRQGREAGFLGSSSPEQRARELADPEPSLNKMQARALLGNGKASLVGSVIIPQQVRHRAPSTGPSRGPMPLIRAVRFWDFKVGFGFGSVSGKNRGFGFGFGFP